MKVGACGICCDTCGLYTRGMCLGCEKTQEHVDFLKGINANCPVLECAVERGIGVCSRDCKRFPCERFEGWPLSKDWLGMFRDRLKSKK
jgi:hypothetical protein